MKRLIIVPILLAITIPGWADVYDLRCEGLCEPLGIDTTIPHFSWKHELEHDGQQQTAYEIQVASNRNGLEKGKADLWKSGKVVSADQVMIPYDGKALVSRQLCYWRVRTWDEKDQQSNWSRPQRFAVGILDEMHGKYIGTEAAVAKLKTNISVTNLKKGPVFIHLNSLGYHDLFVNGMRVGDYVLQPAMSQLDCHSLIITYDITPYLHKGENELLVWIGQGWWKPTTFKAQHEHPLLKAEIDQLVGYKWNLLAETDATWEATATGRTYTGNWRPLQFGGEKVDANVLNDWGPAKEYKVKGMRTTPQLFEGNRITDRLLPVETKRMKDGSMLIDFGRIITGWLQADFENLTKGQSVWMEYTDYIPIGGTFESQGENDTYVARGQGRESFSNRFHHHAFRYVRISGVEEISRIEALQVSALPKSGDVSSFACSDDRLNAVHNMIHYTMECLTFSGYMVDCPHLERTGYGGDGNSSTMTLQTMFDVQSTYMNWLSAWEDNVEDDGSLPHVAPAGGGGGGPYWCGFIIKAPWRTYLNYGDRRPMERLYEKMKRWLTYVDKYTIDGLLQPWPDTDNRMWFLGDWLAPNGVDVGGESVIHANNCFISDCLDNMAKMASILGHEEEIPQFEERRNALNEAIHKKFFHGTYYANGTPLDQAYAILAGVPDSVTQNIINEQLINDSRRKYGTHIAAGLFGVPIFTEWAIRQRQVDLVADILRQKDYPGYLYMIENGATATWESWNSERSRVHNCYNGIGIWFYQALAGIRPDETSAGYRHFFIDPQYPEGVTWVKASKPTPYGPITIRWEKVTDTGELTLDVTLPVGTTATITIPNRQDFLIGAGHHHFSAYQTMSTK